MTDYYKILGLDLESSESDIIMLLENYHQKYYGNASDFAIKNNNSEITHKLIAAGADTRKYDSRENSSKT